MQDPCWINISFYFLNYLSHNTNSKFNDHPALEVSMHTSILEVSNRNYVQRHLYGNKSNYRKECEISMIKIVILHKYSQQVKMRKIVPGFNFSFYQIHITMDGNSCF